MRPSTSALRRLAALLARIDEELDSGAVVASRLCADFIVDAVALEAHAQNLERPGVARQTGRRWRSGHYTDLAHELLKILDAPRTSAQAIRTRSAHWRRLARASTRGLLEEVA